MIKLDLLKIDDLKKVLKWNEGKSSDDLLQWAGPKYNHPLTLEQLKDYFNEAKQDNSNIFIYKIQLVDTNEMIGTVELRETDKENNIGKISRFLIGEDCNRGKGIGTEVLKKVLRIGFEDMKFERITLGVFDFNHSAIKCYENAGFIKERYIENARKSSSGYWNLYEMAILKDKWESENNGGG